MKNKHSNPNVLQIVIWNIFFKELTKRSYLTLQKLQRRKEGTCHIVSYLAI